MSLITANDIAAANRRSCCCKNSQFTTVIKESMTASHYIMESVF